ncbi:MAG: hypothetical protein KDA80_11015, partial [Planctomycetaceae bacterium]|nr:hypothetical protein [Planctomycetaceae bacterium]
MTRRGRPPRKTSGERRHFSPQNAARWVGFQAVRSWRERSVFVSRVLDELFAKQHLSPADRRLATELASETVRRQLTLDTILAKFVTRPRDEVEPDVWLLLQLGVCQLVCLPQIPAHAAVHETVALCEQLRNPRPKGFINGVLRTIERDLHSSNKQAEITFEDLSPNVLPIVERHDGQIEYRLQRFRRPVFDALQPDPVNGLAQMVSLPPWLLRRWQTQGWNEEQLLRTGLWYTIPGQMSL